MSDEILVAENVGLILKQTTILSNVSFGLPRGATLAVVGHNGAGKTSFFHLVLGLKFCTSGSITIQGLNVEKPEARRHLGFVPERPYLNLELTFKKTLNHLGALSGVTLSKMEDRILELAHELELAKVVDRPLKTYSKGMLQRTLIAQALLHDPMLLILDEPMSGLDPEAREFLKIKMKSWKANGKSVLFSSHVMEDVAELADAVVVLDQGKLQYMGSVKDWSAKRS